MAARCRAGYPEPGNRQNLLREREPERRPENAASSGLTPKPATSESPPITACILLTGTKTHQLTFLAPTPCVRTQGKLDRESTMIEMRGHRRLRNRVAAPGRVWREPQRKRRGSGSWPARHCACVSTTRVGAGLRLSINTAGEVIKSPCLGFSRAAKVKKGAEAHAFIPALATGRHRGADLNRLSREDLAGLMPGEMGVVVQSDWAERDCSSRRAGNCGLLSLTRCSAWTFLLGRCFILRLSAVPGGDGLSFSPSCPIQKQVFPVVLSRFSFSTPIPSRALLIASAAGSLEMLRARVLKITPTE